MKGRKAEPRFPIVVRCGNVSVRVYRVRPTSGYESFQVADHSTGKRKLRTFANLDDAKREANRIARRLATGDIEAAAMAAPERASYGRAVQLLKPTGVPVEIVCGHFAEAFQILEGDRVVEAAKLFARLNPVSLTHRSVADVVADLLKTKAARGSSERYLGDLRSRLGRFADSFRTCIADVTTSDIQAWLDEMELSAQSYKNYRTVIGTLFAFAVARGFVHKQANPADGLEKVEARGGENEVFTPAEMSALLAAAEADFLPCLVIGGFCGLRSCFLHVHGNGRGG